MKFPRSISKLAVVFITTGFGFADLAGQDTASSAVQGKPSQEAASSRERKKEQKLRQAEREFTNRDLNQNLVIDADEWQAIFDELRPNYQADELAKSKEKLVKMDLDKDGAISNAEIEAWIRSVLSRKFERYLDSELYQARKIEYDKAHGPAGD